MQSLSRCAGTWYRAHPGEMPSYMRSRFFLSFFMIKAKNLILNVRLSFGRLGHDDLIFPLLSVAFPTNSDFEDFNLMELAGLHNGNGKFVLIPF